MENSEDYRGIHIPWNADYYVFDASLNNGFVDEEACERTLLYVL
jgi:hypothetical protein